MSSYQVVETKPDHHYRTEIPNLVFELGLSPFELTVYLILKRIAGDAGQCTKRKSNLAKDCGMSESALKKSIKSLKEKRKLLGDLPLIEVREQFKEDGSHDVNIITITPIWRLNGDFFNGGCGSPKTRGVGRQKTQGGSPKTHKEEPNIKKNQKQQQAAPPKPSASVAVFSSKIEEKLKSLGVTPKERSRWKYTESQVQQAIAVTEEVTRDNPLKSFRAALKDGWEFTPKKLKRGEIDPAEWVKIQNKTLEDRHHMFIKDSHLYYHGIKHDGIKPLIVKRKINLNKVYLDKQLSEFIKCDLDLIRESYS